MLHICAVRTNAHAHHTLCPCLHALCPAHAKHVLRACQLQQFSWLQWHQWADRDGMKRPLPRTKILMVVILDCDSFFCIHCLLSTWLFLIWYWWQQLEKEPGDLSLAIKDSFKGYNGRNQTWFPLRLDSIGLRIKLSNRLNVHWITNVWVDQCRSF